MANSKRTAELLLCLAEIVLDASDSGEFYHGTTIKAAEEIRKNGFSLASVGARQTALHGRRVPEIAGVYLTKDRSRAEWYAGGLTTPGAGGGAVVEATVTGRLMPEKQWWRLKGVVGNELGNALYDDELSARRNDEAVRRAKEQGFVGFEESALEKEYVVFDPKAVKVVR